MSKANLHSILNRPWYIDQNYGESHLPLVFNVLSGTSIEKASEEEKILSFSNAGFYGSEEEDDTTESKVAIISIKNPITKYSQWCGPAGTKSMMHQMDALKNDDTIAGVVLDIDSGGGQVYGTPEFYDYIKAYPKPVVSYTDGLMCSAAYYIGSAASYIIANKRAEAIGSIGAYTQFLDLKGYYEKQGAKLHTIYASKSTEKNKAYREALEGNYEMYVNLELDPIVDTFHQDMKDCRSNLSEEVFKGGTWDGPTAIEKGLVDAIGTINTAIDKVFELSNNNKSNSKTMNKSYPNIEASLNMEASFESNDEGVFLSDENLDTIEASLETSATAVQTANDAQAAAETRATELQKDIDFANEGSYEIIDEVNASLSLEGDNAVTNVKDAVAALNNHIAELGEQPGATHTNVAQNPKQEQGEHNYIDFNSSIYNN